jgi:transposase
MSTSLLYHAFGVRGYRYVKTEYVKGEVVFTIEQPRESYRCADCGSDHVIGRGQNCRRFRTVSIGGKPVYLMLAVPRVECQGCGAVRQVAIGFADPRVSYTKVFGRYALELSQYMTIKDVANHLGISWDVIKEIQKADLKRRFDRPKLKHLRQIAIDEISTAKGHVYLTIVLDLESGAVVPSVPIMVETLPPWLLQ